MNSAAIAEVSAAFPWFFPAVAFLVGACIGSFLNVVIYRLPAGQSIVHPGSHCACGAPIAWHDNIPILSWFILRGRARCCGRPYSFRYAFVEALTATLFLLCWLFFPPAKAVCVMLFLSALIAATFIDLDHLIIPDVFSLGLGVLGVILSFVVPSLHGHEGNLFIIDSMRAGVAALQGLLIGSGLVLWIALVAEVLLKKEAMGFGDVKFAGAIGAFCGWQGAVFALFGGAMVGTVWFVVALVWQKLAGRPSPVAPPTETPEGEPAPLGFGVHVPFGPMLAIAGALYLLFFQRAVAVWFAQVGELL
ncbi:prepilin peptidase [Opitutus terrae]|uniref:Peptidase A24A domain protein n=1 Tax=Opitutus terrae (strain DSM 11246 / JCM 15787 / PB90-1) TaxID=452637 RepID=B1ZRU8_OPITP|nr:A24 family peptidase [Opitutus terrae]ACB73791.1 peptidase A24A domain protein [Opitutus terrae PB90-1]